MLCAAHSTVTPLGSRNEIHPQTKNEEGEREDNEKNEGKSVCLLATSDVAFVFVPLLCR